MNTDKQLIGLVSPLGFAEERGGDSVPYGLVVVVVRGKEGRGRGMGQDVSVASV